MSQSQSAEIVDKSLGGDSDAASAPGGLANPSPAVPMATRSDTTGEPAIPKALHDDIVMDCRKTVSAGWSQGMRRFWSQLVPTYYPSFIWNSGDRNGHQIASGLNANAYARECDSLEDFWMLPLSRGLTVFVMSFVTFRVMASRTFQNWQRLYLRNVMEPLVEEQGPKLQQSAGSVGTPKKQWKSYVERLQEDQVGKRKSKYEPNSSSSTWWTSWYPSGSVWMDAVLSLALGSSTALFSYDSKQFYTQISQAPLLPGRSLVYETACPAILSSLKELQQHHAGIDLQRDPKIVLQLQHQAKQATGDAVTFLATHIIAHNCALRELYFRNQHKRKQLQSSAEKGHQSQGALQLVPYPGIKGREWQNLPKL